MVFLTPSPLLRRGLILLVLLAGSVGAAPPSVDAGAPDGAYEPALPVTWRLSAKLPPGSALREALVADLGAPLSADGGMVGEAPLDATEAAALLDDPRAQLVYGERTVQIVAPSMVVKQRQDHLDLMKLFLKPERIAAGSAFARAHEETLARTERSSGVDREVIIGILMWESKLGSITGDYQAFNAFTSQAFFIDDANAVALSSRAEKLLLDSAAQARRVATIRERARRNLLALVRQCKGRGIDALAVRGSWAGALGFPQFMPASLRWAEDGNGDGRIDLFDFDDSIASVGRYLAEHGFAASAAKSVWEYNHENAYVQGVLAFAQALKLDLKRAPDASVK